MSYRHFLNGRLVNEDELLISPLDLGYTRGYGVFEFMMTTKKGPFLLERHIERLFQSCESISLKLPWSKRQIAEWVEQTFEANKHLESEKVMRVIVSGGATWTLSPAQAPTIVIVVESRIPRPAKDYINGVGVLLHEFQRYEPLAKTTNYIEAVRSLAARPCHIDEIVYYSEDTIREGTRSNIFAVIDNHLVTPKSKVLQGITRGVILNDLLLSFKVITKDFSVDELMNASEVFITATSKNIMPVTMINNVPVGNGLLGPKTQEVMSKFQEFLDSGS